ncbi:hypothetical protein NK553_17315 [Pseudomonas sp. ZM23]|uniref:Secreted protein n=1 Tax=Pseudomonas triclosanedens TaxID=2961893 RepID=A0ABY7A5X2_9PSED|nr:hypothetical protein [Pseudomonas triclosanedens]MCP8465710.1 hypothetical protein [Pseudomonas triclosanedens]MCP8471205.1 hypothetical protein [Pseudomonas triclosanedens]MCP8477009.1 hypothetical protein [Pseudomonas triclosanedens]WAI51881.1 hypothetical protein OU419_11725 [Pseudomonas triclosanedens]
MKLNVIAATILAAAAAIAAQASFAEESSLMQNRMLNLTHSVQQQQTEQSASHQVNVEATSKQG